MEDLEVGSCDAAHPVSSTEGHLYEDMPERGKNRSLSMLAHSSCASLIPKHKFWYLGSQEILLIISKI